MEVPIELCIRFALQTSSLSCTCSRRNPERALRPRRTSWNWFASVLRLRRRIMKTGKKSRTRIKVEESSGNVFRDLGLENPGLLFAKSTIIGDIHGLLSEHGLTDEAAAKLIGITADDLDKIIRGDLDR